MNHIKLWSYHEPHSQYYISNIVQKLFDDIGIYVVVTYLFIQWLPRKQSMMALIGYIFPWTLFTISVEWIHLSTGHMQHHKGWSLGYSYLANWILFFLFYGLYRLFRLSLLNKETCQLNEIHFTLDKDGRIQDCYSPWLEQNGFVLTQFIGKTIYDIKGIQPHTDDIHQQAYDRALKGESSIFEWEWSISNRKYRFETCLKPLQTPSGQITGIIGVDSLKE